MKLAFIAGFAFVWLAIMTFAIALCRAAAIADEAMYDYGTDPDTWPRGEL
jgi:sugar/nucleoside kinase (ribokinase family)